MLERHCRRSIVLFAAGLTACAPRYQPASEKQIDLLASDAHVIVGEVALVLPMVALPDYRSQGVSFSLDRRKDREHARRRLDEFRKIAAQPATAPTLDKVKIVVETFGWNDADMSHKRICPRLKRRWSQSVCDNPWAPLQQALPPNRFYLVDARRLDSVSWISPGGEHTRDHLRRMQLKVGAVSTVCDEYISSTGIRFCTAATLIRRDLGAVWIVWEGGQAKETHLEQAEREANAIVAFVSHAIGPSEDFPRLLAAACVSRKPNSSSGPEGDDACDDRLEGPSVEKPLRPA